MARTLREDHALTAGHHHAGLTRAQRDAVEGDFRAGRLAVICSTPTLAAGINLPCRLVILFDSQRYIGASTYEDLSCVEVWQRAGRAGRPGLDPEGRCIVMQPSWVRRIPNYEAGVFEPVRSALYERRFAAEQVLMDGGGFGVCGGSEPHRVAGSPADLVCDCADFAAGHRCKHIRAVQMFLAREDATGVS